MQAEHNLDKDCFGTILFISINFTVYLKWTRVWKIFCILLFQTVELVPEQVNSMFCAFILRSFVRQWRCAVFQVIYQLFSDSNYWNSMGIHRENWQVIFGLLSFMQLYIWPFHVDVRKKQERNVPKCEMYTKRLQSHYFSS